MCASMRRRNTVQWLRWPRTEGGLPPPTIGQSGPMRTVANIEGDEPRSTAAPGGGPNATVSESPTRMAAYRSSCDQRVAPESHATINKVWNGR